MRKPTSKGSKSPAYDPAGKAFAGGRALERVRQFERARGLGPPKMAQAPDLPPGAAEKLAKPSAAAAKTKKPKAKRKSSSSTRSRRSAPSRSKERVS